MLYRIIQNPPQTTILFVSGLQVKAHRLLDGGLFICPLTIN